MKGILILLIGVVLGVVGTKQSIEATHLEPGTITRIYQKGFDDGMTHVSGYWASELQNCYIREGGR